MLAIVPALLLAAQVNGYVVPPQLYSPLIAQKIFKTAATQANPSTYPHYTKLAPYGSSEGKWQWFGTNTWTSGFFPGNLMLLNERGRLCPSGQLISVSDTAKALAEGRKWSAPLTSLEVVRKNQTS